MRVVTAITGASGALYAARTLSGLLDAGVETHLVVSPLGRRLLADEMGIRTLDEVALGRLTGYGRDEASATNSGRLIVHPHNDVGSVLASGSFLHDGMVIVPCSSNTLAEIACGLGSNLIARAAAVTLKERRRLIVCHREMPLSPIDVGHYATLTAAGAILAPANPGFYLNPTTVAEVVDFVAGKLLDLLGVPHAWPTRWDPDHVRPSASPHAPSAADVPMR